MTTQKAAAPKEQPVEPLVTIVDAATVSSGPPQAGTKVTNFIPSVEDAARLAKNGGENPPPVIEPERTLIGSHTSRRTMAEMERGAAIVEQKRKDRQRLIDAGLISA